jgi:hypothetical protein
MKAGDGGQFEDYELLKNDFEEVSILWDNFNAQAF